MARLSRPHGQITEICEGCCVEGKSAVRGQDKCRQEFPNGYMARLIDYGVVLISFLRNGASMTIICRVREKIEPRSETAPWGRLHRAGEHRRRRAGPRQHSQHHFNGEVVLGVNTTVIYIRS